MSNIKTPRTLRSQGAGHGVEKTDPHSGRTVAAVPGLDAVASFSNGAEAQQSNLPPVTIDAPVARPRPAASRPTADHVRARSALRRAARTSQPVAAAPVA